MEYERRFFDPPREPPAEPATPLDGRGEARPVYLYDDDRIVLAVNVALATDRPLLIAGPPGSGKTTLARNVAEAKRWRYLQKVVTSRTQIDDLLASFDALQRLNDAYLPDRTLLPDSAYVEPGVLWWAFEPESAAWRGVRRETLEPKARQRFRPATYPTLGSGPNAVVLLDEIDKADPDVPNDLLEPLDRKSFQTGYREEPIRARGEVLVVITTNGERELPPAFMRRCVFLKLEAMRPEQLVRVAEAHYGSGEGDLYARLAGWHVRLRDQAQERGIREPGTAEFLDTVRACLRLRRTGGTGEEFTELWNRVARATLWKHESDPPSPPEFQPAAGG